MDANQQVMPVPATLAQFLRAPAITETGPAMPLAPTKKCGACLGVALIDSNRFSLECLSKAFEAIHLDAIFHPHASTRDLAEARPADLGLILYHSNGSDVTQFADMKRITEIRAAYPAVPLVVLSDADDAQHPNVIRKLMEAGAVGVVTTKTMGISMSLAVICLVKAGGTFVPPGLLLSNPQHRPAPAQEMHQAERLTERQMAVLAHLNSGKANKLIAYELGMSESTVKVHVRNIMRKMNATNRTQAVYKARKLWGSDEMAMMSDS